LLELKSRCTRLLSLNIHWGNVLELKALSGRSSTKKEDRCRDGKEDGSLKSYIEESVTPTEKEYDHWFFEPNN